MRAILPLIAALVVMGCTPQRVTTTSEDQRSTISVIGDGRVVATPDVVSTSFGVESASSNLSETENDAFMRMQAVINAVAAQGIARDDIKTRALSVQPEYDSNQRTRIRGYRVVTTVQVQIRDTTRAGQVIDAAVQAGANRVDGISFTVADMTPIKDQARAAAFSNARAKADQLAGLGGVRIVGIKSISESDASGPVVRAAPAVAAAPAAAAPPIEPGEQEVRTQIQVTYLVE